MKSGFKALNLTIKLLSVASLRGHTASMCPDAEISLLLAAKELLVQKNARRDSPVLISSVLLQITRLAREMQEIKQQQWAENGAMQAGPMAWALVDAACQRDLRVGIREGWHARQYMSWGLLHATPQPS